MTTRTDNLTPDRMTARHQLVTDYVNRRTGTCSPENNIQQAVRRAVRMISDIASSDELDTTHLQTASAISLVAAAATGSELSASDIYAAGVVEAGN